MKQSVKLVAGNWKMNGLGASLAEAETLEKALKEQAAACRVALCPPATLIDRMAQALKGGAVEIGGQDCHAETSGAYTGSVSAEMVRDAGARLVILGHSERRAGFGETDADVAAKVEAALAADLEPIICIGETLQQREAGLTEDVIASQLRPVLDLVSAAAFDGAVVAYEPVWAIGTGRTASPAQAQAVHAFIRGEVARYDARIADSLPILYGGSVKPDNASELFSQPDVDGGLVGGASLVAADFIAIARAVTR